MEHLYEKAQQSAEFIRSHMTKRPKIAVVLGSGLGNLTADFTETEELPYRDIPNFPVSTVEGHKGALLAGRLGEKEVFALEGRFHFYEGYSMKEVCYPFYVLKLLGVEQVVLTNACGGINRSFAPGTLMLITDFINMMGTNPLIGPNDERFGPRFPDMTEPYSAELRDLAKRTADELGIPQLQSPLDADGDGVDDWTDMVLGARAYIGTHPHYKSKYYAGGYPDDGLGVCTDVIWQAFRAAGYSLKDLVDRDIADHPACYPNIETPDGNIDFRRVSNLDTFFRRHAQVLTCELDDPAQWQPGDIVIFGDRDHIGICSDRRNRQGIPFLIHHGNPIDEAVERNDMGKYVITGHFRWMG